MGGLFNSVAASLSNALICQKDGVASASRGHWQREITSCFVVVLLYLFILPSY